MKTLEERFWKKVNKTDLCWVWIGTNNGSKHDPKRKWPYGQIRAKINDKWFHVQAHRISWEINHGPIPDHFWVLHHCDNTLCVRPDHLFLGNAMKNTEDMIVKNRAKFGGGKGAIHKKRGKFLVPYTCLLCGKVRMVYPSIAIRNRYCSLKCRPSQTRGINGRFVRLIN